MTGGQTASKGHEAGRVALLGCGFVADLYMRSFAVHPEVTVVAVHDRDAAR